MTTAQQLGIPEAWHAALVEVTEMLERGELQHVRADDNGLYVGVAVGDGLFNMNYWSFPMGCGSAHCIGGWCERVGDVKFPPGLDRTHPELNALFFPGYAHVFPYADVTTEQAARAARSYLDTGKANWEEALR